jgi:hypothetical protein
MAARELVSDAERERESERERQGTESGASVVATSHRTTFYTVNFNDDIFINSYFQKNILLVIL